MPIELISMLDSFKLFTIQAVQGNGWFSGAFAKLRKATIEPRHACLSAYPSVLRVQLGCHWTDFHEIWFLIIFRKLGEKIQVSLRFEKSNGYVTWRLIYIFDHLPRSFLEWEMFRTKVVEKIKTHILCSITFVENRSVYEIMWKNILELERPRMTIWRMRVACWISKGTDTHSEYVVLITFSL